MTEQPVYSRRFSTRIEVHGCVCIYWSCAGVDDLSPLHNLSIGGLFMTTHRRNCSGAIVRMDFLIPDGRIRAEAVVRHIIPTLGLGLELTAVAKEDRPHLAALMARLRGSSRVRHDSSNSSLAINNCHVIDLTDELPFEK